MVWRPTWYSSGVKYISDLLDSNGKFLSYEDFENQYMLSNSFLDYISLIHVIPRHWREKLNS